MHIRRIITVAVAILFLVLGIVSIIIYNQLSLVSKFNGIPRYVLLTEPEVQKEFRYLPSEKSGWTIAEHLESGMRIEHPIDWRPSETVISNINGKRIAVWSIVGPSFDDPPIIYLFSTNLPLWQAKRLGFSLELSDFSEFAPVTFGKIKGATQRWEYRTNAYNVWVNRLTLIEKDGVVYGAYELHFPDFGRTINDIIFSIRPAE